MYIKTDEHKMILPEDLFMPKDLLLANRDRNTIIVGNNKGNISDYIGLSLMQGKPLSLSWIRAGLSATDTADIWRIRATG